LRCDDYRFCKSTPHVGNAERILLNIVGRFTQVTRRPVEMYIL